MSAASGDAHRHAFSFQVGETFDPHWSSIKNPDRFEKQTPEGFYLVGVRIRRAAALHQRQRNRAGFEQVEIFGGPCGGNNLESNTVACEQTCVFLGEGIIGSVLSSRCNPYGLGRRRLHKLIGGQKPQNDDQSE